MKKIKKGDEIIVRCGKDKGKRGTVLRYVTDNYIVIQGLNMFKKHVKPNPTKGTVGGITEFEKPIHISNVSIYNPTTKKADRVGIRLDDNNKSRIFKSNKEQVSI
ncbi:MULTISPECIES: 50S ribosomal protein L24 [Nitrosomonas]|uniref:Large ribosomal subunit protein uL24 n=1 Tax=Nitrosomonas communis TaxID=44574 RepID=A0A0F7KHT3_9PROT|nr:MULTISPECIES: 50S ribosomal protein L24 [Nitrosomonas]AKH39071.1 50S ribosomal protein L24 [Nitrosomonas communis]TYP80158.1 large subunit ribosomal protein L24 [Nitrosomonas communis]UVS61239.1 50S ribosomal protein L24 [Nitrosomonas sp. PLL12]